MRVGVIAVLVCLTLACFSGAIAQDQIIITNGISQITEELCKDDGRLFYFPDGLGWQVYGIGYSQPMWIDFSEYPSLQELKSNAISSSNQCVLAAPLYGVQPVRVTVTLDLLSGDLVLRPGCSSEELANVSAPSGYQPGQWPADCRVVDRLLQQWQTIQSDPDWQDLYGSDATPFLTFHFQLADLINEKPVYDEAVVAEEEAQATVNDAETGMFTAMTEGEGGGEFEIESVSPCTITNLTQPFVIVSIQQGTNLYTTIAWESCPIFRYLVLSANELRTNTVWLQRAYTWGNTNATSWTDTTTTNLNHRFYKVQRLLGSPIAAGARHSLVSFTNNTLWAFGLNQSGQLGDGTVTHKFVPVDVSKTSCGAISNVSALAAGPSHSVAADSAGAVWTWGDDGSGQLGNGSDSKPSTVPWPIAGVSNIVSVAAGEAHTLAVRADGTVWAWGDDLFGQLGVGGLANPSQTNSPAQSSVLTQAVAIAAGAVHSVALQDNGAVWAWGWGLYGQLGNGGTADISVPTVLTNIDNVIAVAAGALHTVALKADKTVWTWGGNTYGQLGRSTADYYDAVPGQVPNLSNVVAIAAGYEFSLAVRSNGDVYAWGDNSQGQFGTNAPASQSTPYRVPGISNVVVVSANSEGYYVLAVTLDQGAYRYWAWGNNEYGQVGNGTNITPQYAPTSPEFINSNACSQCVQLGTNGAFTAQCTGTLKLYFNDRYFGDNSTGSYTCAISNFTAVTVAATASNGVVVGTVTNGVTYTYTASGWCAYHTSCLPDCETDPNGIDRVGILRNCSFINEDGNRCDYICPRAICFSLVGKIE